MAKAKIQKHIKKKEEDKKKKTQTKKQNKVKTKLKVGNDKDGTNELVWAKLRFCPYWPARISAVPTEMKTNGNKKGKVFVFFFGSKN